MRANRHRTLDPKLLGMAAVLAALTCVPSSARANCGDHVYSERQVYRTHLPGHTPAAPEDGRRTCSGPACSQAPSSPPLTPAPTTQVRSSDVGLLSLLPPLLELRPSSEQPDDQSTPPVRYEVEIYHPPRSTR